MGGEQLGNVRDGTAARFHVLGPLEIVVGRQRLHLGGPKQRAVLALLLIRAGQVVAAERLVEELWEGRPPVSALVTLRSHVSRLRARLERAGGGAPLVTQAGGYVLRVEPEAVDAHEFERLVREGREAAMADLPKVAVERLKAALELWRGPLLADLADLGAVQGERARLEELRLAAWETRIEAELSLGRHVEVSAAVEALVAEHPLRENLYALRMLALYGSGRQGEAGIGKTRTAREMSTLAQRDGFLVLWGGVWEEDGAPAFWPWLQALRAWVEHAGAADLRAACGSDASVLAQLIPAVAERIHGLEAPPGLELDQARFRLFDAVARVLRRAAARLPLLLVLDDLHRADIPSLRLLQFLARELADTRIFVLGTFQDVAGTAYLDVLSKLLREPTTDRLRLRGLSEEEVIRYVETAAVGQARPSVIADLLCRTGGNPFFLRELVRLWRERGRPGYGPGELVPEGVLAAVTQRLRVLPGDVQDALAFAAVIGRVFTIDVLKTAARTSRQSLLGLMEQAAANGLVTEVVAVAGQYYFTHALVRDAVYMALSRPRRASLHKRVAKAIEQVHRHDLAGHLAELAHHFRQAGHRQKAARFAVQAGEQAMRLLAYEEAVRLFGAALDDERDSRVALLLAEAQIRAGDIAAGKQTCLEAASRARELGRHRDLAEAAALWYSDLVEFGVYDPALAKLLEEALEALEALDGLGHDEPALRAKLLARSAMTLWWTPAAGPAERRGIEQRCRALSEEAAALARRQDDPAVLPYTLYVRHLVLGGPEYAAQRLVIADEIVDLAGSISDRAWDLQGRGWRVSTYADLDDFDAVDSAIDAYATMAERLRLPRYLPWIPLFKGLRAFMAGDLDEAERLGTQALAIDQDPPEPTVLQGYGAQLWMLRREQGRLPELISTLADMARRFPGHLGWRAGYAAALTASGDLDAARHQVGRLAEDDFGLVPNDRAWLFTMTALTDSLVVTPDSPCTKVLYELLLPFEQRCATVYGVASTGPVALHLGRLAEALGHSRTALLHYENAAVISLRLRAKPWMAQAKRLTQKNPAKRPDPSGSETLPRSGGWDIADR